MACDSITDYVVRESGRLMEEIVVRDAFMTSPWLRLMPRGVWPSGRGQDLSVISYERNAPSDSSDHLQWNLVSTVDGNEGGSCLNPPEPITIGSTKRTFYLYQRSLQGPDFCAVDLHSAFELAQQLNAVGDILTNRVKIEWEMKDRFEYFKQCNTKVIVDACPPSEYADSWGVTSWTSVMTQTQSDCSGFSILTQGVLDIYRAQLLRDGAVMGALGMRNGAPVLTLISSFETSDNIIKLNADVRQDLRWGEPNKLLAPLGVVGDYRGFYHVNDGFPRRFNCTLAGTITEVAPFTLGAASKGQKATINSSWRTATLEESFIFDRTVMTQLVPQPIVNPAPNFTFNPVSYIGTIQALNIIDRVCNPLGTILFHRADMAAASMPNKPERGVAFLHLRCDPACNLVTSCST